MAPMIRSHDVTVSAYATVVISWGVMSTDLPRIFRLVLQGGSSTSVGDAGSHTPVVLLSNVDVFMGCLLMCVLSQVV